MPEEQPTIQCMPTLHHSAEFRNLYAALIKAQREFTPVVKNKIASIRNPKTGGTYTYKYADLADVLAMALPVLTKHELGLMQPHIMVRDRLRVSTRLIHASGEWLMSDGVDMPETGSRQDFGTDSTYNRRYDACTLLAIVADEDIDAQKNQDSLRQATPALPRVVVPLPATPANPTGAEKLLLQREALVKALLELCPGPELGKRAAKMFPNHKSTKTLTVADLELFYQSLLKERSAGEKKPAPVPDVPPDVAAMFDEGKLTTASRLPGPTIGKGLAHRLHKMIGFNNIHTEEELRENYLKPCGVEHVSDLPKDLYETLCAWAEGTLQEGTENGE